MDKKMADPELTKAFAELQMKIVDINHKVKGSEGQIAYLKRELVKNELTEKELKIIPKHTNMYLPVGRMFILEPPHIISKCLTEKQARTHDKIKVMEEQISYWKKGVKESEENLRDMVSQRIKKLY